MNNFVKNEWIFPGNVKTTYDHVTAFTRYDMITWSPIPKNIKVGDIVYIYSSGKDFMRISYRCEAVEIDVKENTQHDEDLWVKPNGYNPSTRHANIKLRDKFPMGKFELYDLNKKGASFNPIPRPQKVKKELSKLLNSI